MERVEQAEWKGTRSQREPWWECRLLLFGLVGKQQERSIIQKAPSYPVDTGLWWELWEAVCPSPLL